MNPSTVARNFIPTLIAEPSLNWPAGVSVGWNTVHGQLGATGAVTVTFTTFGDPPPVPAVSRFPESSNARLLIVAGPCAPGVQEYVQLVVPVAGFQVVPRSTETSTPAMLPPPESTAVPVIAIALPLDTVAPLAGKVIWGVGGFRRPHAAEPPERLPRDRRDGV